MKPATRLLARTTLGTLGFSGVARRAERFQALESPEFLDYLNHPAVLMVALLGAVFVLVMSDDSLSGKR